MNGLGQVDERPRDARAEAPHHGHRHEREQGAEERELPQHRPGRRDEQVFGKLNQDRERRAGQVRDTGEPRFAVGAVVAMCALRGRVDRRRRNRLGDIRPDRSRLVPEQHPPAAADEPVERIGGVRVRCHASRRQVANRARCVTIGPDRHDDFRHDHAIDDAVGQHAGGGGRGL